jgi:hypothetical protein
MNAARSNVLADHGVVLARAARERYGLDEVDGRVTGGTGAMDLAEIRTARAVAHRLNTTREPGQAVPASELAAFGLLDEVLRVVLEAYQEEIDPAALDQALREVRVRVGRRPAERTLEAWEEAFAPQADPHATLEELLLTWLGNANEATRSFRELVDDRPVARTAPYPAMIEAVRAWSAEAPGIGPDQKSLIELLRAPALASPDSLAGQIRFILDHWVDLLGDRLAARLRALRDRLQAGLDQIAEEERATFMRFEGARVVGAGGDAAAVHGFGALGADAEQERFSQDVEWMPRVVLIAKSTYVWLD